MKTTTQKIILASMMTAVVCVTTMIIKIPSPLKGYMNLGDSTVLLCGWMLPPVYGFLAAGIGSALADFFSGYAIFIPATFIIKGLMALAAYFVFKFMLKRTGRTFSRISAGIVAELIMAVGYLSYESLLYGFGASVVNIPANIIQGVAGLVLGTLLAGIFERNNLL